MFQKKSFAQVLPVNGNIYFIYRRIEDNIHTPKLFPHFPCHTQSVERAVKLVTEAAAKVEGEDRRHGEILATVESRKSRKNFNSKKEYKY